MRRTHRPERAHSALSPFHLFSHLPHRALVPCLICWGLVISGCEEDRDPHTPDGALRLFGVMLAQGDTAEIYQSLSGKTHRQLDEVLKLTRQIKNNIRRFPSERAQKWALKESLGDLITPLQSISSSQELLNFLIKEKLVWAQGQAEGEIEQGLSARSVSPSVTTQDGAEEVVIVTRAQDQVTMRLEQPTGEPRWVVCAFEPRLKQYITSLKASLNALETNRAEWVRRKRLNLPLPSAE